MALWLLCSLNGMTLKPSYTSCSWDPPQACSLLPHDTHLKSDSLLIALKWSAYLGYGSRPGRGPSLKRSQDLEGAIDALRSPSFGPLPPPYEISRQTLEEAKAAISVCSVGLSRVVKLMTAALSSCLIDEQSDLELRQFT